jgi:hypothetical protein
MARSKLDLRPLIPPALAALVAAGLLAGVISWTGEWLAERERAFRAAERELAAAAREYRSASDDQAVYEEYAARFRDMRQRGWIGPEERLTWIEALQAINRDLQLPTLRYDIAQRQPVGLDGAGVDPGRMQLYRTTMNLTLGALHEGDLFTVLGRLANDGQGLAALESCRMRRAQGPGEVRLAVGATNLEIGCTLHWYSLEIRTEDEPS